MNSYFREDNKSDSVELQQAKLKIEQQPCYNEEYQMGPARVYKEEPEVGYQRHQRSEWQVPEGQRFKTERDSHTQYGQKRRYDECNSNSHYEHHENKRACLPQPTSNENGDNFDSTLVVIDTYNSDLYFKVSEDRCIGYPFTNEGFAYLWSGARATYGVSRGRVCFEMKIIEEIPVKHLPTTEPDPHVVRVGWSLDSCSTQLGEQMFSYGYGGTGKKSTNFKFQDYGEKFGENDVIGCYIDFNSHEHVKISFSKNGRWLDVAFQISKDELAGRALFPHILVKNCAVKFNFGQCIEPFFPLQDGYTFIQHVKLEDRVRGTVGPASKADCEILMMVGLPACGKTTWATKHAQMNPEKKYNILGTNAIMEKMKVMGLRRQRNYAGRWDMLIQQATQCLNQLIKIASNNKRNYILDQTNVYGSAQKRKMRPFEGFQRKAIVICPTDWDLKERSMKQAEEGKDVPDHAVLEMKANFTLPEAGDCLDEVIFIELQKEEASVLVKQYNEEGRKAGPPPEKRSDNWGSRGRASGFQHNVNNRGTRGGYESRGGPGGGYRGDYRGGNHQNQWGGHPRASDSESRDGYNSNQPAGGSYNRYSSYNKEGNTQVSTSYRQGYNEGYNHGNFSHSNYNQGYGNYSQQQPGEGQRYNDSQSSGQAYNQQNYNQQYDQYAQQWPQHYQNQDQWNQYSSQYGNYSRPQGSYSSHGPQGSQ